MDKNPGAARETPQDSSEHGTSFELVDADDHSKYLLYSKKEIFFLLRAMCEAGDLISVHFNQGRDFFLSVLVSLGAESGSLLLDPGSDDEVNRRALEADKLILVATHDKVKIQFSVPGIERVQFKGREAFRAPLPSQLLRLQRREFFRLSTPLINPLVCVIPMQRPDGSPVAYETTVADISGGGLAVVTPPPEEADFQTGQEFDNCRIELPEIGTITTRLRVRNTFEFTLPNGTRSRRSGCQFINLPGQMLTLIQRYIIKVERERKARETGML